MRSTMTSLIWSRSTLRVTSMAGGYRLSMIGANPSATEESSMRALVVSAPNEFAIEEVPRRRPGDFEVLCRVRAVAICGTDPHIIQGHYPGFWPMACQLIPGHEWCGLIEEVG